MRFNFSPSQRFYLALLTASLTGVGLFLAGVALNQSWDFWYLPYNLTLALLPLLFALLLVRVLKQRPWLYWQSLLLSLLWILFLPNSFYIVSDFIHLNETPRVDIVQDIVMLTQFSLTGLVFGFASLFMVHQQFAKRISARLAGLVAGVVLLLCSFAIYLGRDLRWNSWDILLNPLALLGDMGEIITMPLAHPQALRMTLSFFVMLGSLYAVMWYGSKLKK